jgi:hypothetical protein
VLRAQLVLKVTRAIKVISARLELQALKVTRAIKVM